jgi:large subunit ribosomal protein L17
MKKQFILGRKVGPRKALFKNLGKQLVEHKHITTTLAKAKGLRLFIEPILTKAKKTDTHSRRQVFSAFQDKKTTKILFNEIAPRIKDRAGGYTRIIKLPPRPGDNAKMAFIELVDYGMKEQSKAE